MCQWISSHWFRYWLVAYLAPSHYLNQCWVIVNWTLTNKVRWNFNQNTRLFIHENALENFICKTVAILSRGGWVDMMAPVGNMSSKLGFFFTNGCFCQLSNESLITKHWNPRSYVVFSLYKNVYNLYHEFRFYLRSNFCYHFESGAKYKCWPSQEGRYCVLCEIQSHQLVNAWQSSKSTCKQNF